jgi:hypothetical protein
VITPSRILSWFYPILPGCGNSLPKITPFRSTDSSDARDSPLSVALA